MVSLASDVNALPLGPRPTGAFAAVAVGSALGSTWLLATASAHLELPFGARSYVWNGLIAAAVLAALLVRWWASQPERAFGLAALGTAAAAVAAVAFGVGASGIGLPLLVLVAVGGTGLLPSHWLTACVTAIAAGLVLLVWNGSDLALSMPALALLAEASAIVALPLAAGARGRHGVVAPAPARRGQWLAIGVGGALLASLPPAWFGITAAGVACSLAVPALALGLGIATNQLRIAGLGGAVWLAVGLAQHQHVALAPNAQVLAVHGGAAVHYQRDNQQLALYDDGDCIDVVGPDCDAVPLLAVLAHAFGSAGDRVALLGLGAGRVFTSLDSLACFAVDAIDWRPDAQALRPLLLGDGPVGSRELQAPPVRRFAGLATAAAALPPAARQLLVLGEPVGAAVACTPELQRLLRSAVGEGLVLQAVALQRVAPVRLQQWFAAATAAHPWNGLFVVGDAAVLVSAAQRPRIAVPFAQWSEAARWLAHAAHLGGSADVQRALCGTLRAPLEPVVAGSGALVGRAAVLPVLHAWLQPAAPPAATHGGSLLLAWSAEQAELRRQLTVLRGLDGSAAARGQAQAIALRFLPRGAPHPLLQAALGLADAAGVSVVSPALASRRALALDPTFFRAVPPVYAELPTVFQARGDLEDLAALPPPARLAVLCGEDTPLGVALRARFPSRCAQALVAQLARGPLSPLAGGALRELGDPFVLQEAARAVAGRAGERELLGLWRHDLPAPDELLVLLQREAADRAALAAALRGRPAPNCRLLLAGLLEAAELEVRVVAGEVLREATTDAVPYAPHWPQSARHEAAERLRSLHNRAP